MGIKVQKSSHRACVHLCASVEQSQQIDQIEESNYFYVSFAAVAAAVVVVAIATAVKL